LRPNCALTPNATRREAVSTDSPVRVHASLASASWRETWRKCFSASCSSRGASRSTATSRVQLPRRRLSTLRLLVQAPREGGPYCASLTLLHNRLESRSRIATAFSARTRGHKPRSERVVKCARSHSEERSGPKSGVRRDVAFMSSDGHPWSRAWLWRALDGPTAQCQVSRF
jgi:hypothetical protein